MTFELLLPPISFTLHWMPDMDHELQPKADELIRALGALGFAQESAPNSPDVSTLTSHAKQLHDALSLANADR